MITAAVTVTERSWRDVRLELDGMKIHIQRMDTRSRAWKPRVYLSGSAITPDFDHPPYGSQRGDGSPEDKAWRKYNREEVRLQRALATRARDALRELGALTVYGPDTFSFSRYAGCSCPCSPGLIWNGQAFANKPLFDHDTRIGNIWVEADA